MGLYHWITCLFIFGLVFSQLLGAIWDSTTTNAYVVYGRSPELGPSQIVGTNDVPYADRVIACVGKGRVYEPRLVSSLLAAPGDTAILEDSTGKAVHGYRLKQRRPGSATDSLDSLARPIYAKSCALMANTIDNIFQACLALGYTNLTRDHLRVVDDWDSKNLYLLPNTLPILIMPFWDNSFSARHAMPTWGGDACIYRPTYTGALSSVTGFQGVNQSIRHERTMAWLNRPGGTWKNGWYEDKEGGRWYSDVVSSVQEAPYLMKFRQFNLHSGEEVDCSHSDVCKAGIVFERWGDKFSFSIGSNKFNSVYIANGTEYGLFMFDAYTFHVIRSVFDWETLLSNVCTWWILHRWALAQVLIVTGALRGTSYWSGGGISSISASRSFAILPFVSLPRFKMTLTAFWTVGCAFEGQQRALAEAWFAIYPGIVHFVLIYFSILNLLAKVSRRRVSDVLFTPTVVILCLMHYLRMEVATSGWLTGVDGRVATVVFSDEVDQLQLADYFSSDIAWRMNGRVSLIFHLKLCILAVNLLPLLLGQPLPTHRRGGNMELRGVEKALALSVKNVGGLGSSSSYIVSVVDRTRRQHSPSIHRNSRQDGGKVHGPGRKISVTPITPHFDKDNDNKLHDGEHKVVLVSSYELIRLGYLVFGDMYLTTFQEYGRLCAMAPLQAFFHLWNNRVLVWPLRPLAAGGDAEIAGGRALESTEPQMWRLDDPRLQNIRWWQVSACSIQC